MEDKAIPRIRAVVFNTADIETATKRIIDPGGSHLEAHKIPGFAWRVMADPDENEFCIGAGV